MWGLAALAAGACAPAQAMTTLSYHWTDVSCSVTRASGVSNAACSEPSFQVSLSDFESATVSATLHYTYHDDGLPLDHIASYQLDAFGVAVGTTQVETGVLLFRSRPADGRTGPPPGITLSGSTGVLTLGSNAHADDLSGSVPLYATLTTGAYVGYVGEIGISVIPLVFASPVPEPSSAGLIALGLLGLWVRAAARSESGTGAAKRSAGHAGGKATRPIAG